MKILYLASFILLLITSSLAPVKQNKSNFIFRIILEVILIMAFNVLAAIILFYLKIPANLISFSILYGIITSINSIFIWKKKKIQEYEVKIGDIIFTVISLALFVGIFWFNYGYPAEIKYGSTDASTHFSAAFNFMKNDQLLIGDTSSISKYLGMDWLLVGAYVNNGILMSLCEGFLTDIQLYQIYMLFDLMMLWLSSIVFYEVIKKVCKNTYAKTIAIILTILYVLGYPLNSVLMGSAYLTLSLLIITCIYWAFMEREYIQSNVFTIIVFLLNIFLMHSYILFAIMVIMAEAIYWILTEKKQAWKKILLLVLLPAITLFLYSHETPERIGGVITEGPMYRNYYSNFLIYIPFVFIGIWHEIKEKNWLNFENVFLAVNLIAILVMFVLKKMDIMSSYYCFKYYYVLWGILFVGAAKGICILLQKRKKVVLPILFVSMCIYMGSFFWINIQISPEELMKDISNEKITSFSEIYRFNYNMILEEVPILKKEEIELIVRVKQEKAIDEEIQLIGSLSQINWYYAFLNEAYDEVSDERVVTKLYNLDNLKTNRVLGFKRAQIMHYNKEAILKKYQYSYEEKYGGLLTRIEK